MKQAGANQEGINNELYAEQAMLEQLFSKAALKSMDAKIQEVPLNYFNEFPDSVLKKIRSENNKTKIIHFVAFKKMAIAAAVLIITATGYLFSDKTVQNNEEIAIVNIEAITNEEIEHYVESNELFVEVDWESGIDNSNIQLELNYTPLNKDSNKLTN
jgi:hypothetical protein